MKAEPVVAVVDDDASLRLALSSLLKSFDMKAVLFGSGEALLASAHLPGVSCVLTDVLMPGMNGFALCEQLRARGHAMPVIFMTAYRQDGYAAQAASAGAACLLSKPFTTEDVMGCIANALGCPPLL